MKSKSGDKVVDVEQGSLRPSEAWRLGRLNPANRSKEDDDDADGEDLKLLASTTSTIAAATIKPRDINSPLSPLTPIEQQQQPPARIGGTLSSSSSGTNESRQQQQTQNLIELNNSENRNRHLSLAKVNKSLNSGGGDGGGNHNNNDSTSSENSTLLKQIPAFNGISLLHGHYTTPEGHHHNHNHHPHHNHNNNNNSSSNKNSPKLSRIRMSSKFGRVRKRVVFKNGECNLHQTNISKRRRRYLADIFTTLVDLQWRWTLLIFTLSFLLSWLSFAMVWWLIAFTHGDLEIDHLPDRQEESNWKPCVGNFFGFTSAFLFSIETQHTIGYGSRYTTEECPEAVFVMCFQSILGMMIQAFMVGVVFSKMSRPKKRTQTLVFSRHGVICQRDGELCLMFRIGDMRKSHIISANVRAQLIKRRTTAEGEILPFYQHELKVGVDSDQSDIFFIWPMIVVHRIDKDSPLYATSAEELLREKFEIVIILEGVIESTGATTQARSSYIPSEILWGHRFESLVGFRKDVGEYTVDYSSFNNTYEIETPLCSAKDLEQIKSIQNEVKQKGLRLLTTPFRISSLSEASSTTGK